MKKFFWAIVLLWMVQVYFAPVSQAQENKKAKKMVIGKWKLTDLKSPSLDLSKMSDEQKKAVEEMLNGMMESSSFVFEADGRFEITMAAMGDTKTNKGTWKVDAEGKTLITTDESGKEQKVSLAELTSTKMVLKEGDTAMTLSKQK